MIAPATFLAIYFVVWWTALFMILPVRVRSQVEAGDRVVWQAILAAQLTRAHHGRPTVNFRTRYLAHYHHFGKEPPPGAKHVTFAVPPVRQSWTAPPRGV